MAQEVLGSPGIHEGMKPGEDQRALAGAIPLTAVADREVDWRLSPWVDRGVEASLERVVGVARRGGRRVMDGWAREGRARSRSPVECSPREGPPEARRGPWTVVQQAIEGLADARGWERSVALDDQHGVVADRAVAPERRHRHEDQVGAAQGKPAGAHV